METNRELGWVYWNLLVAPIHLLGIVLRQRGFCFRLLLALFLCLVWLNRPWMGLELLDLAIAFVLS
jgi:hypothetical protein